jgi:Spy/CpxP family protein refolding chaperone
MQKKTKMWLGAAIGAVVVMGTVVRAQNRDANNPYRAAIKARFDALAKQVNLSEAQKKSIASIVREAMPQGRAIAQNKELSNAQKQQQMKALRATTRSKIAALLSPEQRQSAQKLFESRKQRVNGALQEIADELQLTEKQRAAAKPVIKDAVKQGRAIFQGADNFAQKRAKLMQLRAETHQKLASILTPEQMQKLDQIRDAVRSEASSRMGQSGLPIGRIFG